MYKFSIKIRLKTSSNLILSFASRCTCCHPQYTSQSTYPIHVYIADSLFTMSRQRDLVGATPYGLEPAHLAHLHQDDAAPPPPPATPHTPSLYRPHRNNDMNVLFMCMYNYYMKSFEG